MELISAESVVDEIMGLMEKNGGEEYAGEKVSQLQHMYQAAELAREANYSSDTVLAAFLHDIGHISETLDDDNGMNGWGIMEHEKVGANYLQKLGFSKTIADLVDSHVYAKRYLTWKDQSYYDGLSEASKKTLEFQGGIMSDAEAIEFEKDPLFEEKIKLRMLDDKAKIEQWEIGDLDIYKQMMIEHLLQSTGQ